MEGLKELMRQEGWSLEELAHRLRSTTGAAKALIDGKAGAFMKKRARALLMEVESDPRPDR